MAVQPCLGCLFGTCVDAKMIRPSSACIGRSCTGQPCVLKHAAGPSIPVPPALVEMAAFQAKEQVLQYGASMSTCRLGSCVMRWAACLDDSTAPIRLLYSSMLPSLSDTNKSSLLCLHGAGQYKLHMTKCYGIRCHDMQMPQMHPKYQWAPVNTWSQDSIQLELCAERSHSVES